MLTKCIGIISYFPDDEPLRTNRKNKFLSLLNTLDTYFKLPIIIVAQNWREEDFKLKYDKPIKIYNYNNKLGITKARVILREKLLLEEYDYYIFLDDDIEIKCNQQSVDNYFKEIDNHPNMFGQVDKFQLFAISKYMLYKMGFEYIKNLEAYKGEIWEDVAYYRTYKKVYNNNFYKITISDLKPVFTATEKDLNSTWYHKGINQTAVQRNTMSISDNWIRSIINDLHNNVRGK